MLNKTFWLSASAMLLAGCATPFATSVGSHDFDNPETDSAVMVGELRGYARETLINDRRREIAYLEDKLEDSKHVRFEPQLKRQIESLTGIVGQLQASLDPASGAVFDRKEQLQELEAERQLIEAERTLLLARRALEALQTEDLAASTGSSATPDVSASGDAEPEAGTTSEQGGNTIDQQTGGGGSGSDPVTTAPITQLVDGYGNEDLENLTLGDVAALQAIANKASSLLDKVSGSSPIRSASTPLSPRDDFRDRQDYRAELRAALSQANLDDVHDLDGNALYRLQTRITVLPNSDKAQFGATQLTFKPPQLDEQEVWTLYWQWLGYLNDIINDSNDARLRQEFLSLARASRSTGIASLGEKGDTSDFYLVMPYDAKQLWELIQCDSVDRRRGQNALECEGYSRNNLVRYSILKALLSDESPERNQNSVFGFEREFGRELASRNYDNRVSTFGIFREGAETIYPVEAVSFSQGLDEAFELQSLVSALHLSHAIALRVASSETDGLRDQIFETEFQEASIKDKIEQSAVLIERFNAYLNRRIDAIYRDIFEFDDSKGGFGCEGRFANKDDIENEIDHIRDFQGKFFTSEDLKVINRASDKVRAIATETSSDRLCFVLWTKIDELRNQNVSANQRLTAISPSLKVFQKAILSEDGRARGNVRTVDAMPHQQVQRISSTMGAANAVDLAFAVRAQARSSGIGGILGANFVQQSLGRIEAIESTPIVVSFTDSSTQSAGWIAGPKLVPEKNGKELAYRYSVENHPVSVDVSAPGWWPKVEYSKTSKWIGNWNASTRGKLFAEVETKTKTEVETETAERQKQNGDKEDVLHAKLSNNSTDMQTLTRLVAGLSVPINRPTIIRVSPSDIKVCPTTPNVTLQIKGRNIWQSSRVFLNGREADSISILPDMNGLSVSFDLKDLPKTPVSTNSRGGTDNALLAVWTRDGDATFQISIDYDAQRSGFCGQVSVRLLPSNATAVSTRNWAEYNSDINIKLPQQYSLASQAALKLEMKSELSAGLVGGDPIYTDWVTVAENDEFTLSESARNILISWKTEPKFTNGAKILARIAVTPRQGAEDEYIRIENLTTYYTTDGDRVTVELDADGITISDAFNLVPVSVKLPPRYAHRYQMSRDGGIVSESQLVLDSNLIEVEAFAEHSGGATYQLWQFDNAWLKNNESSTEFTSNFALAPFEDADAFLDHLRGEDTTLNVKVNRVGVTDLDPKISGTISFKTSAPAPAAVPAPAGGN